ncbi:ImmA/IrrE family metallo-endopeptidase [Roseateles sp. L2-2]|uniref:ImmA/IrrE family metallo-endopeptidase n=1 Tax=Roseateles sp. L2-2 TaxID=3422597 RepID=UPI003D360F9F
MSTTLKGDTLEIAVFNLLKHEIESGDFWAKSDCCQIHRKKGYFSKDREANIVFDVSIEIRYPGADTYSMLVLVECKNYDKTVPVDDLEEFFAKVQQVGAANAKAVFVTRSALQRGALQFAKSKGIGVARYFNTQQMKWELRRSPSATLNGQRCDDSEISAALTQPEYKSAVFDLFFQTPSTNTNSLNVFFDELLLHRATADRRLRSVRNSARRSSASVPFISMAALEQQAQQALSEAGIEQGYVDLHKLCERHPVAQEVQIQKFTRSANDGAAPLGRIRFDPPVIELLSDSGQSIGRERFTFAHELGHLLLRHGMFLRAELCDEADHLNAVRRIDDGSAIGRMEFQANQFASCLLMPRQAFLEAFIRAMDHLDLRRRGSAPLYVDAQPCNIGHFLTVTNRLMFAFGASRAAVAIRLSSLGLMKDVRRTGQRRPEAADFSWLWSEIEDEAWS